MNCTICGQPLPCAKHSNDDRTATGVLASRTSAPVLGLGDDVSEPTSKRDPLLGKTLGDYEIRKKVGEGGMGVVYEGYQPLLGRRVAIKFVRKEQADTADQIDALLAEARTANLARHRHIIDVFGFGKLEGHGAYLVMEYLEGTPLDEYMVKRGALTPLETIKLLDEVLSALAAAHARGVIHRDLKPSNVFLVTEVGSGHYAKLLDFGLAKAGAAPNGATPQTHSGVIVGTPEYMAPEQALGKAVSPKTDLYAVGIMAFEMLTARLPFPSGGVIETAMHHVNTPAPDVRKVDPSVPEPLSDLVGLLLMKNPDDRPDGAEAVRARLKQIQRQLMMATTQNIQAISVERTVVRKEPLLALAPATPARHPGPSPITPVDPTLRPRSRAPIFAAAGVALALALVGGGWWATRPKGPEAVASVAPPDDPAVDPEKPETPPVRTPDRAEPPEPSDPSEPAERAEPSQPATASPRPAAVTPDPKPAAVATKPVETKRPDPRPATVASAEPKKPEPKKAPATASVEPAKAPAKAEPAALKLKMEFGWADYFVDGAQRGHGTKLDHPLPPGFHKVRLTNPEMQPIEFEVTLKPGEVYERTFKPAPK
ncbi:MAG: protein kinase [Myxococcales bacterium]